MTVMTVMEGRFDGSPVDPFVAAVLRCRRLLSAMPRVGSGAARSSG
jgi:hypothetical protein